MKLAIAIIAGLFLLLVGCATCPDCTCPEPNKETVIIDIEEQSILVECRTWDDHHEVKFTQNGTITVEYWDDKMRYVNQERRLLIIPDIRVYFMMNDKGRYDIEYDCHAFKDVVYTVTIDGKQYKDSVDVEPHHCRQDYHCGVPQQIERNFK
jgi:hypothetical protein